MSALATQTVNALDAQAKAALEEKPLVEEDVLAALLTGKKTEYIPLGEERAIQISVPMVQAYVANKTKKGVAPSVQECLRFIMLCRQRRLNPFVGDCFLVGYDNDDGSASFSMIVAVQALLKRAEIHPQYEGMESGIVVMLPNKDVIERQGDMAFPGDTIVGGWARVHRKDRKFPSYQRIALATYHKKNKFWNADPGGMICKTAEAHAQRQAFPSDVGGLYLDAEIDAYAHDAALATSSKRSFLDDGDRPPTVDLNTLTTQAEQPPPPEKHQEKPTNGSTTAEPPAEPVSTEAKPALAKPAKHGTATNGATDLSDDDEFQIWKADIDKAATNGALDKVAEEAGANIMATALRNRVLEAVKTRRETLKNKK
jgi:phage recombination protein Bet